jgi:hypothetical protein
LSVKLPEVKTVEFKAIDFLRELLYSWRHERTAPTYEQLVRLEGMLTGEQERNNE